MYRSASFLNFRHGKPAFRHDRAPARHTPLPRANLVRLAENQFPDAPAQSQSQQKPKKNGYRFSSVSDRKSTRLNSSHGSISYAVFCLKKKKKTKIKK